MINTVHLGLSYACNLRCRHCFVDKSQDKLTFEDYIYIIDNLYKEGLFVVIYTYGEPLLSPRFFDVAKYAKEKGLVQVVMTNGTLISDEIAMKMKEVGIHSVYVSIDSSDAKKHDENRGVEGVYEKSVKAISCMKKCGLEVGIATTVTNENCFELENIYQLAQQLDVKTISFLRERNGGRIVELRDKKAYIDFFVKHVSEVGNRLSFHDAELREIIQRLYENGNITQERKCFLDDMNACKNQYTICVQPDGRFSKCNFVPTFGKRFDEIDFEKFIRSEIYKNENTVCYS